MHQRHDTLKKYYVAESTTHLVEDTEEDCHLCLQKLEVKLLVQLVLVDGLIVIIIIIVFCFF